MNDSTKNTAPTMIAARSIGAADRTSAFENDQPLPASCAGGPPHVGPPVPPAPAGGGGGGVAPTPGSSAGGGVGSLIAVSFERKGG